MSLIFAPDPDPELLAAFPELTPRQLDVLALVAEGWSNSAIAERLFVTVRTVESHVWAILMQLGLFADNHRVNRRVLLAREWHRRAPVAGAVAVAA